MKTLAEKLKKPESDATCRIPAIALHGDVAHQFQLLVAASDQSATRTAAALIQHVLSTDASIKKLIESQNGKPLLAKKDAAKEQQKEQATVQPTAQRTHA